MSSYNVGILGATGAVGQQMLECLQERDFPVADLRLFASARSAGKTIEFKGEKVVIEEATPQCFKGCDIVLGAAGDDIAKELLPHAVEAGATVIDNSHAFRMDEDVPLVVPEINGEDVKWNKGIIANPNCATIIGLVPTWPLHQAAGVQRMIVSTYQAASGAGVPGMRELESQIAAMGKGEPMPEPNAFAAQLASNLIPQIGNTFISAIKDTSVLNVISVTEVYFIGRGITGTYYRFFETFFIISMIYLFLTFVTSRLLKLLERKLDGSKSYDLVVDDADAAQEVA